MSVAGESTASSVTIECDKGRYHTLKWIGQGMHMSPRVLVRFPDDMRPRSYSLQFRILYFVLYWRLIRLDFPAAMTLPPRSP